MYRRPIPRFQAAHHPVAHFMLIGALLFALTRWLGGGAVPRQSVLDDDEALYQAALANGLERDDPVVQQRLLRNMRFLTAAPSPDLPRSQRRSRGRNSALYRDAVQLGLATTDLVVRRRLIERMRLHLENTGAAVEPSDAELQAYLEAHAERFAVPARVRLSQIFVRRQPGNAAANRARRLLKRLNDGDVISAAGLGDPLPLPADLPLSSEQDLARVFGPELAAAALTLTPGRWQGPVTSPYGLHLIRVQERVAGALPPLASVRASVRARLLDERADAALQAGLRDLRAAYSAPAGAVVAR